MLREEWLKKIEELGGHQPFYARISDKRNELSPLELIYVCWDEKLSNYQKIRNKVAKEMRQDGWLAVSSTAMCEGHYCAIIKAERSKQQK
jgi:hypothetical protein